jgi:hypothetical protein
MQKLFYSMREVCEMLGVARSTIDRWELESGFPKRVYLGHVAPVRLHDKRTRVYLRTKRSNCRIGFPKDEGDALDSGSQESSRALEGGRSTLLLTRRTTTRVVPGDWSRPFLCVEHGNRGADYVSPKVRARTRGQRLTYQQIPHTSRRAHATTKFACLPSILSIVRIFRSSVPYYVRTDGALSGER